MGLMQYYRTLYSRDKNPFITVWKTDNAGISTADQIALPLVSSGSYNFRVYYGATLLKHVTSHLDNIVTFPDGAGEKEVYITGKIEGWQFNNSGDRLKILGVVKWGNLSLGNNGQYFNGCNNLSFISDAELNTAGLTNLSGAFAFCSLTEFPAIDFPEGLDFTSAWRSNLLSGFPLIDVGLGTDFNYAWFGNSLITFPPLDFSNGSNFRYAWNSNSLSMFPLVNMNKGTNFDAAWGGNRGMVFPAINFPLGNNFNGAWRGCRMTSFPLIDMPSAVNMNGAFYDNRLTSFPAIALPNATNCSDLFYGGLAFTDFKARDFSSMTSASRFLNGSTMKIPTSDYSELLISLANNNTNTNVTFHMAASKYNASAIAARNTLVARGWNITDGGLE